MYTVEFVSVEETGNIQMGLLKMVWVMSFYGIGELLVYLADMKDTADFLPRTFSYRLL